MDTKRAAHHIAFMVTEWVEFGLKHETDWREGLERIIERRLKRLIESDTHAQARVDSEQADEPCLPEQLDYFGLRNGVRCKIGNRMQGWIEIALNHMNAQPGPMSYEQYQVGLLTRLTLISAREDFAVSDKTFVLAIENLTQNTISNHYENWNAKP